MRYILFISALLFTSLIPPESPSSNILKYKILKDGKEIGAIKAVRTTQGNTIIYDIETHMNIKVLINQKVDYTSKAFYENGILQSSVSRSYINDKQHNLCVTTLKGGQYIIKTDKDNYSLNRTINYSGAMLYFREPGEHHVVYSEMSGQDNYMKKIASGQYVLTNSKSKKQNKYWYKSGILERAFLNHTLIDIEIHRVN